MARLFAFNLLFFLLPFIVYGAFLVVTRGSMRNVADWQLKTIAWLALGGSLLMVIALLSFTQFQDSVADRTYVPARFEDGKIVPGELVEVEPDEATESGEDTSAD